MASPTTANLPTRQQLDEIDALLRRMLTLPPLTGEPAETPAPPAPPSSYTFPAPVVREIPPARPTPPGEPIVQAWRVGWPQSIAPTPAANPPSVAAWGSPAPVESPPWAATTVAPPPQAAPPFALPVSSIPATAAGAPAPVQSAAGKQASESLIVLFLEVLNGTFNLLTYLLGPLGTWLRGPGRNALGWAGVMMTLVAAVWGLGNWYGYDWPKPNWSRFSLPR